MSLALIFLGGGAGATCRYELGRLIGERYSGVFPLGTFTINVSGCYALGLIASLLAMTHQETTLATAFGATGFLGGFTTFSTYALEGFLLYVEGSRRPAVGAILGSVVAGTLAAAAGAASAHAVHRG